MSGGEVAEVGSETVDIQRPWETYIKERKLPIDEEWGRVLKRIDSETTFLGRIQQVCDMQVLRWGLSEQAILERIKVDWTDKREGGKANLRVGSIELGGKPFTPLEVWLNLAHFGDLPEKVKAWWHESIHVAQRGWVDRLSIGPALNSVKELREAQAYREADMPIGEWEPSDIAFQIRSYPDDYPNFLWDRMEYAVGVVDRMMVLGMGVRDIASLLANGVRWQGNVCLNMETTIGHRLKKLGWDEVGLRKGTEAMRLKRMVEKKKVRLIAREGLNKVVEDVPISEDRRFIVR